MPKEPSRTKRTIYFSIFTLFFILCIPAILLYSFGYTIDGGTFGLSSRGGIYVSVTEPDITVYIGDDIKETTGIFRKEVLIKDLKPKDYLVVTGSEEFWPWAKIITVTPGEVSALYPLLVRKTFSFKEILKTDENYVAIAKLFLTEPKNATIASSTSIMKSKMKIWKENNSIFASWLGTTDRIPPYFCNGGSVCASAINIFQAAGSIGRIDFYPDREDAIMLILDHGIYAMEIDGRKYHNFYPIYKGNNPDFRIDGNEVYIKDGNNISVVEL